MTKDRVLQLLAQDAIAANAANATDRHERHQLYEWVRELAGTASSAVLVIDSFDKQCAQEEYTDTNEVWRIFNNIRLALNKLLEGSTAAPNWPVHVLSIDHKHGTNLTVHATEDGALNELRAFVELWWDSEVEPLRSGDAPPIPEDRDEAIEVYFDATANEDWRIEETVVQP